MPEVASLSQLKDSIFLIKLKQIIHNKKESEVYIVFEYAESIVLFISDSGKLLVSY